MPVTKKNNISLNKGKLFDRKGFVMKEYTELLFNHTEVDFAQICIESKRWCKPGKKKGTLLVLEEKKLWISADAMLSSAVGLQKTIESLKQAIKYAKVDGDKEKKETYSKQLKAIKGLVKQTKDLYKHAEKVSKEEFDIRHKNKKGEMKK